MMRLSKTDNNFIVLMLCICISFLVVPESAAAGKPPVVRYSDGLLTVKADNAPLIKVLEEISEAAGIDIFVSKDFIPEDISIQFTDLTIKDALKQILKGTNYAAIYLKEGESFRLTALKVYPEGKYDGEVIPIFAASARSAVFKKTGETKTVLVSSGHEVTVHSERMNNGNLVSTPSLPDFQEGKVPSWFVLQKQLERKEVREYEKLMLHKMRLEETDDPDRKEALVAVYADEIAKFYDMKKASLNKIESIKRIYDLREMTQ